MTGEKKQYFVTCAPGVELALLGEARQLKLPGAELRPGGLAFEGERSDAWRANLWLRSAVRVLERVAQFRARDVDAVYRAARDVPWERFLAPEGSLLVDGRASRSAIDHTQFLEQRVKDAVVDRFRADSGTRPSVDKDNPDLRINAHVHDDRVTLSVDTSGASLHRRGWRQHQGKAPLAETTAAALLLLSEWDGRAPLIDPFCGTGTLLIEAAWIADRVAPGLLRTFGFERWNDHDPRGFAKMREAARSATAPRRKLRLVGRDVDPERITDARANAEAAGLDGRIDFEVGNAVDLRPRPGWNAWVVTNPPYGKRVTGNDARDARGLHRDFGNWLREHCEGYRLALLAGDEQLAEHLGFRSFQRKRIINGGLECELVQVQRIEPEVARGSQNRW